jgi:hypothetical protein
VIRAVRPAADVMRDIVECAARTLRQSASWQAG